MNANNLARGNARTNSPKGLSEAQLTMRRTLVFRLRSERRLSYRAICAALAQGTVDPATGDRVVFDITPNAARYDYWKILEQSGYLPDRDRVEEARGEELDKCDRLEEGLAPAAFSGDPRSVATFLRVMERRARLLGLDVQPASPAVDVDAEAQAMVDRVEGFLAAVAQVREQMT